MNLVITYMDDRLGTEIGSKHRSMCQTKQSIVDNLSNEETGHYLHG